MPDTILIDGKPHRVTDALSSGPGTPVTTYELEGGAYVRKLAHGWELTRPRPVGPVGTVTVEVPRA